MAKAELPIAGNPLKFNVVGGVDESVQVVDTAFGMAASRGNAFFYVGTPQRLFGKKLVDANPEQSMMGLSQLFNGYGQFGYYVQSMEKLYYHLCETPADLFIDYTLPSDLGVDEDDFTRDIFGQSKNLNLPQDTGISCLFAFPDKPTPPEVGLWLEFGFEPRSDGLFLQFGFGLQS